MLSTRKFKLGMLMVAFAAGSAMTGCGDATDGGCIEKGTCPNAQPESDTAKPPQASDSGERSASQRNLEVPGARAGSQPNVKQESQEPGESKATPEPDSDSKTKPDSEKSALSACPTGAKSAFADTAGDVTVEYQTGEVPVGTGGTIEDGEYHLTSAVAYNVAPEQQITRVSRVTIRVRDGKAEGVTSTRNQDEEETNAYWQMQLEAEGSAWKSQLLCVEGKRPVTEFVSYTASPSEVVLYNAYLAATFAKQE